MQVLSLLRVESLTVEGMMSRSFGEADHQKNMVDIKKQLEQVEQQLEELSRQQISSYLQPLVKFYEKASAYLQIRKEIMVIFLIYRKKTCCQTFFFSERHYVISKASEDSYTRKNFSGNT